MSAHLFTRACFHEVNSIILIIKNDSFGSPKKGMNMNPPPTPRNSTILAIATSHEAGLSLILHVKPEKIKN